MKSIKIAFAAVAALVFTSCGTYTYQETTSRYVEPSRAGFITPVVADMEVSADKIVNAVEIPVVLKKREVVAIMSAEDRGIESGIVMKWKKYALAETLKKYKADDIVAPTFTITPSPSKQNVLVVTVTGHTAVYQNFRKATKADVELFAPFVEKRADYNMQGALILQHTR